MAPARFKDLCLDAADHQAQADWWCRTLGYVRHEFADGPRDPAWPVLLEDPTGAGPALWINPVPEPKTVKNRMHVDVVGDRDELLAAGATVVLPRGEGRKWDVLADPEGNEFCAFDPREAG
ncbi:VOC family protein [Kineococcus sp. SYSU DK003]|uniref:VOC family protein n=1 Tax=Kineococcus sp. SYSU DK003 TaxID=3383124 RepID=UPI003D7DB39D